MLLTPALPQGQAGFPASEPYIWSILPTDRNKRVAAIGQMDDRVSTLTLSSRKYLKTSWQYFENYTLPWSTP